MSDRQVDFWRGDFGNTYTSRNNLKPELARARVAMWSSILGHTLKAPPASILEVGANIGVNLRALRMLSGARMMALEPNDKAREILVEDEVVAAGDVKAGIASAIGWPDKAADLVFTSGVLIHIHPDNLHASMREIHRCSARWIVSVEYFADRPTEVAYRGHNEVLFKRDFGGEWLDLFPELRPVAYGFEWKRVTGLDNLTWWLFEKP
jgi:spore coat polysaccharide biosynthesis protein SpsF